MQRAPDAASAALLRSARLRAPAGAARHAFLGTAPGHGFPWSEGDRHRRIAASPLCAGSKGHALSHRQARSAEAIAVPARPHDGNDPRFCGGGGEALRARAAEAGPHDFGYGAGRSQRQLGSRSPRTRSSIWKRPTASSGATRDAELTMFAQANSEHCRPQDFQCRLDHRRQAAGAFAVRDDPPHARVNPRGTIVAYCRQRRGHGRAERFSPVFE